MKGVLNMAIGGRIIYTFTHIPAISSDQGPINSCKFNLSQIYYFEFILSEFVMNLHAIPPLYQMTAI